MTNTQNASDDPEPETTFLDRLGDSLTAGSARLGSELLEALAMTGHCHAGVPTIAADVLRGGDSEPERVPATAEPQSVELELRSDEPGPFTGGCLCGRVRYRADGDPVFAGICHCRNCQRFTGSAFEAIAAFPSAVVQVEGELKTFVGQGGSGRSVYRRFCPNCGSGVLAALDLRADVTYVLAGTLDEPDRFRPTIEVFCRSAQPWLDQASERARFATTPAVEPVGR